MRDSITHEENFLQFVKNHDEMKHIQYSETPIENQKVIGVLVTDPTHEQLVRQKFTGEGSTVIDPNYDNIYEDFLKIDHDLDSVEYIKNVVESKQTQEEVAQFVIDFIIKKLLQLNIATEKVYVAISPNWDKTAFEEIVEV